MPRRRFLLPLLLSFLSLFRFYICSDTDEFPFFPFLLTTSNLPVRDSETIVLETQEKKDSRSPAVTPWRYFQEVLPALYMRASSLCECFC